MINGFYGPALLLAEDELNAADTDEQREFWQTRIRHARDFEAQLLELYRRVAKQLD